MKELKEFLSEVTQRLKLILQEMPPGQQEQVEAILMEPSYFTHLFRE